MLLRNILEIALVGILLLLGLVIYLYTSRRVRDVESDMSIRKKKDIHGKLEDEE
jgi:hypothetical protein